MNVAETAQQVRNGEIDAIQLVDAALADIAVRNEGFNCFTRVLDEDAYRQASQIDADRQAGKALGSLAGVPFGVKDLYDVAGYPTLGGSKILQGAPPASSDAALVASLKSAGAILIGNLNMDEFAYGFSTENAHYGPTRNPHDTSRIAGGSSGGSAAAVAAGLVPFSLGSDTNGSIRVPAALCGVFGMKPTFGRLSTDGTIPLAPSLDHMGHFARSAADLDIVYRCMTASGTEGISGNETVFDPDGFPASLRVGLLDGWFRQGARPEALAATEQIASAFTNVHLVELPEADRARSAAYCITAAEAGRIHLTNLRDRAGDFDHACRDRLIAGALLPTNLLVQALRFQQWFRSRVAELIDGFDLLLAPATPCSAPRIGQVTIDIGGVQVPARANLGIYTQPLSFVGLPIITLPVHQPGAMPLGVQLIGKPWTESLLLAVTCELERRGIATSKPFGPSSK